MLLGRRYFRFVAALLLIAAGIAALLPILEWLRRDGPSFGLYDMRGPRKLPPYEVGPDRHAAMFGNIGDVEESSTVYGPHWTYHTDLRYSVATDNRPGPPVAILEVEPGGTATLPDGEQLRIIALALFPQNLGTSAMTLPAERVYVSPDIGTWMGRDAAVAVNTILGQGNETVTAPRNANGMAYSLDIALVSNLRAEDVKMVDLFDSRTGGSTFMSHSSSTWKMATAYDGFRSLSYFSTPYDAVRPTPLIAQFEVRQGPETVITLKPEAPQKFKWNGFEYTLRNVSAMKNGQEAIILGEPKAGNGARMSLGASDFKLVFDYLPPAVTSVRAFGKDGAALSAAGSSEGERNFRGKFEELDRIEIHLRPDYVSVIFKLPNLPVVPEANRKTTKLMDMVLPPVVVTSEWEWRNLIAALAQARLGRAPLPTAPLTLPLDLGGKTVREVLAMEHRRYPPHEMALTTANGSYTWLERRMPGFPYALIGVSMLLTIALLMALPKAALLLAAASLRGRLRPRGYADLTIWDAEYLAGKLGRGAWRLPLRDDLATIPGVDIEDMDSIVAFMRRREA